MIFRVVDDPSLRELRGNRTRIPEMPRPRPEVLLGRVPRGASREASSSFFRVVKTPVPEWTKQILASAERAEASVSMSETETDLPQDVQDEIRVLAAAEAEALATDAPPEAILEETPEELEADEEARETEAQAPKGPPTPPRPPRRFEFLSRAGPLRTFLAQVAHLVDEAKVVAIRDAWRVLAVDPAHVALIDVRLEGIDALGRTDGGLHAIEEDIAFGVDVEKILALVKKAKRDDTVRLTVDLPNEADEDGLILEIGAMHRTMAAIDTADMADPKIPTLDLPAKLEISAAALLEAAKACEDVTDHVRLTATAEGLNVFGEGDVDKVSIDLRHGDEAMVETRDAYTSLFPLDHLMAFLKVVKDEAKLVVRLGTDYPIRVDWDGVTKGTWLCAPRIESHGD